MSQSEKMSAIALGVACLMFLALGFGAVAYQLSRSGDALQTAGGSITPIGPGGGYRGPPRILTRPPVITNELPKKTGKGTYTLDLSLSPVEDGGKLTAKSISAKDPGVSVSILSQKNAPNELALVLQLKVPEEVASIEASLLIEEDNDGAVESHTVPLSVELQLPTEIGESPKTELQKDE